MSVLLSYFVSQDHNLHLASEPIGPNNRLKASPPALPQCGSGDIEPLPFFLFPYMGIG